MTEVTTDTTDRSDRPVAVGGVGDCAAAWSVVPMTSCGSNKPHQRKRQRAEKSSTLPKKPRIVSSDDDDFE